MRKKRESNIKENIDNIKKEAEDQIDDTKMGGAVNRLPNNAEVKIVSKILLVILVKYMDVFKKIVKMI